MNKNTKELEGIIRQGEPMRKGGTAKALQRLTVWCFIITVLGILLTLQLGRWRSNYTELHRMVRHIEIMMEAKQ